MFPAIFGFCLLDLKKDNNNNTAPFSNHGSQSDPPFLQAETRLSAFLVPHSAPGRRELAPVDAVNDSGAGWTMAPLRSDHGYQAIFFGLLLLCWHFLTYTWSLESLGSPLPHITACFTLSQAPTSHASKLLKSVAGSLTLTLGFLSGYLFCFQIKL